MRGMTDATLELARAGDSDAFAALTDPYRRELHMHCYRILGSYQDAEDVLQETMLSAWQAIDRFDGSALRAWLYRIATNRCLNYLRDASRRPKTVRAGESVFAPREGTPSDEPWWLEPYPDVLMEAAAPGPEARYDARESIALSFVAGLQRLPTQQRTALVLRDVLGFSAAEAAEMLSSTPASVNSALQRARRDFREPADTELVPLPRSKEEAAVAECFADAYERGDIDRIVAILTDDCRATMPPEPIEVLGPLPDRFVPAVTRILGQAGQDRPHPRERAARLRLLHLRRHHVAVPGRRAHGARVARRPDLALDPIRRLRCLRHVRPPAHDLRRGRNRRMSVGRRLQLM